MAKSKLTNKQKKRIYQLLTEDNFSQKDVATLFKVSQGTISSTKKEMEYEATISELKKQQENAMTRGVQAAIKNGEIPVVSTNYIDSK